MKGYSRKRSDYSRSPLSYIRLGWDFSPGPGSSSNIKNLLVDDYGLGVKAIKLLKRFIDSDWFKALVEVESFQDSAIDPDDPAFRKVEIVYRDRTFKGTKTDGVLLLRGGGK